MTETLTPIKPLVSVIIPVYNGEKYLKETIESVIAQTEKNWEIVAVNDGSVDGSQKILEGYEKLNPDRIRVISVENGGISRARNTGADLARGTYLAFLDHDDLWAPYKMEHQLKLFSNDSPLWLAFTNVTLIDEYGKIIKESCHNFDQRHRGYVFELLIFKNFIPCSSIMVKRDNFLMMGGFDPQFRFSEDYDFLLKVTRESPVDYIDEPLLLYRWHKDNTCYTNRERMKTEMCDVFIKWVKIGPSACSNNLLLYLIFRFKVYYINKKKRLLAIVNRIFHCQLFFTLM